MRDELEKLIIENRAFIMDEEPDEGHIERFQVKLNQQKKHKLIWRNGLKIAAAVVFVLMAVNQARLYLTPEKKTEITLSSISNEYREVEFYYTSAIDGSLTEWERMEKEGLISASDQQIMNNEMKEFEQMYHKLQQELEANPGDERVINAMLEFYQSKLNVVTMVVEKLKEVKEQKRKEISSASPKKPTNM
jgi:hypothetical protein